VSAPTLLDLFCGEGGAGAGYAAAGFDVTGVDHSHLAGRHHRGRYILADALAFLTANGGDFDAIHASPPCLLYTTLAAVQEQDGRHAMDLIWQVRAALIRTGRPWVLENVPGAPLIRPLTLCGSMFGLGAQCRDGRWRQLRRHRLFESNCRNLTAPRPCDHQGQPVGVYGIGAGGQAANRHQYQAVRAEALEAMGTPWMSKRGVVQAIPPAYTTHLAGQILQGIQRAA
jgi:DNA (cytosine-5)-methyltransferase 1